MLHVGPLPRYDRHGDAMTRQIIHQRACYVDVRNCMLVALERATASRKAQVLCVAESDGRLALFDLDSAPGPGHNTSGFVHLVTVSPTGEVYAP